MDPGIWSDQDLFSQVRSGITLITFVILYGTYFGVNCKLFLNKKKLKILARLAVVLICILLSLKTVRNFFRLAVVQLSKRLI
jgi:hypothetical protein